MADDPYTVARRQMEAERANSQVFTGLEGDKDKAAHAMTMADNDQDAATYAYGNYDLASKAYRFNLTQHVIGTDPMLQTYFNTNPMASIISKDDVSNLNNYNKKMLPLSQAFSNPVAWLAAPAFLNDTEKDPGGMLSVGIREFGHALPAVAAGAAGVEPGMAAGAALGAFGGPAAPVTIPVGTFLGGLFGGILTAYLAGTAERAAVERFFPEEAERLKRGEEEHPISAFVGSTLAMAPLFGVGGFTKKALLESIPLRAAGAGIMGTVDAVQQMWSKGEIDPLYLTGAAVGGAIFAGKPTMFGEAALGLGRAVGTGRFITRFFRQGETPPQNVNPVVEEGRVEETKEVMGRFDEAIDAAKQSETRNELSPDLFAKLTEQHTKAEVGVKREAVEKLLGDKVPEPGDGVLGDVPRINEQLELFPKLTGEDVKIPFSTLVKLEDEVVKSLHDDVRARDDLYTLNEAKEVPPAQDAWPEVPPEEVMRDAGFTDSEMQKPDAKRLAEAQQGFAWIAGDWRKVTPEDVSRAREAREKALEAKAKDQEKFDAAVEAVKDEPGKLPNFNMLGADWQVNLRGFPNTKEGFIAGARQALENKYRHEQWNAARLERIAKRTLDQPEDQQLIDDVRKGAGLDPLFDPTGTPGPEPDTVIIKPGVVLPKRAQERLLADAMEVAKEQEAAALAREEKKAARRRSAEWNKESVEMFDEVAGFVDGKPDVQGWKFMVDGELRGKPTGAVPKINPASLSQEQLDAFPKHWLSPEGLDADLVARELGFKTGDDFAESMIAFREAKGKDTFTQMRSKLIQAEIKQRMESKYGPFERLNADEARELVASPKMEDFVWSEWKALGDVLGVELPITRENVKAMAALDFGNRPHTKATLMSITRELGRAGRAAHDAWAKDDLRGAFDARQRSVHLMALAREAAKFETRKKGDNRIMRQLWKREPTNMEPEYADWAHQIMLNHQIPTQRTQEHLDETLARPERRYKTLPEWVNSKNIPVDPDKPMDVGLPQGYQDWDTKYPPNFPIWEDIYTPGSAVYKKPFDELTVREYKGVTNALRVLKKVGQDESGGIIHIPGIGDVVTKDIAIKLGQAVERFDKIAQPKSQWLLSALTGFRVSQTKILTADNFFSRLASQDENGPWMTHFIYTVRNQEGQLTKWNVELAGRLGEVLKKQDHHWWRKGVDNTAIINPVHGTPLNMNNGDIVLLWLVTGSKDAINHTAAGYKMKPEELIAVRNAMSTREHFDMAMDIAKEFGWAQGHVDNMTMKRSGTIMEKEEPGIVQTPWGDKPGWYYPRARDRGIDPTPKASEPHPQNLSASLPHGFMEERTGDQYAVKLKFDAAGLAQDLKLRLKFAAMQPIADMYNKIIRRAELIEPLQRRFGNEYVTMLDELFNDIGGQRGSRKDLDTWVNRIIGAESSRMITDVIGFNLATIEKHSPQSIAQSVAEVGFANFFKEAARDLTRSNYFSEGISRDFIRNGGMLGGQKVKGSDELRMRRRNYKDDPVQVAREMTGQYMMPRATKVTKELAQVSMFVIRTVDQYMSEITATARYRQLMRENVDRLTSKQMTPEEYNAALVEAHNLSISKSDRMVAITHGSSSILNQPEWLRSQNAMVRSGAMAMAFFNNALQRRLRSYYMIMDRVQGRSPRTAMEDGRRIATDIFIYGVLPTLIEDAVEPLCKSDEDNLSCSMKFVAQGLAAPIPILRDIVHGAITGTPITYGIYNNLIKYGYKTYKSTEKYFADDDPSKLGDIVENFMGLTGGIIGAPGAKLGAWSNYGIKYYQGEESLWRDWEELQRVIKKGKTEPTKHEEERQSLYRRLMGGH